ncbi:MAG: NADH-quinone oxidoreductase subunit NuoE [Jatrophihabitans sp.]
MPDYELTTFSDAPAASAPTNADAGRTNFRTSVINLDRPGDPSVFSEQVRVDAAELMSRYPIGQARSALLPLLHLVQSEQGYVTPDGIAFCADILDLTKAQVAAVATFYTMYKRHPTGEYLVSVCTNTLCGMLGGDEIFAALKEQLEIGNNDTTPDGSITLEHAECLAACDYAPVVTVNYEFFDNQTVASARDIVSQLQSGERPEPTRGAPLCTFRQIERQIAGIFDAASLAPEAVSSGPQTEVGVKLAIELGHTAPSYAVEPGAAPAQDRTSAGASESKAPPRKQSAGRGETTTSGDEAGETERKGGTAREAVGRQGADDQAGPSDSDAPLETAESDPASSAEPGNRAESTDPGKGDRPR